MNEDQLRQMVVKPKESAKLDFKLLFYKINETRPEKASNSDVQNWSDRKEQQWAELTKDILALANGNLGTASDTGYLIVGADDKLRADGTPNLIDVGNNLPNRGIILNKVNSYCQPRLPDIQCETIFLDSKSLFVISIPPSPYLYRLSKQLKTPKKEYSPHSVLIRRGDGEETYEASHEEQEAIRREKEVTQLTSSTKRQKQAKIQGRRQKLSIEVYERKIEIYRITRNFLTLIYEKGTISIEELLSFAKDTDEALFLFDQQVANYLHILYKNGAQLYFIKMKLNNGRTPVGEERSRLAEEEAKLLFWFTDQIKVIRDLFYKHISL